MKDATRISSSINELKNELNTRQIDFLLLPNSDEFFCEYLPESEKRIQYLSGFSGSNATIIFGAKKSYFFTDGRYLLQAKNELDLQEFEIINISEQSHLAWLESNLKKDQTLALLTKLSSLNFVESCQEIAAKNAARLDLLDFDLVEKIWPNRPQPNNSAIFFLDEKLTGEASLLKRKRLTQKIDGDAMLISKPENLCWLLNLRAADAEFTPLLLAYGILFKNGNFDLFANEKRFEDAAKAEEQKISVIPFDCLDLRISALKKSVKKIQIDSKATNYWLYQLLENGEFEINFATDATDLMKSQKNSVEIKSIIKAHEIDGATVTKFLFWLKKSLNQGVEIDEISASEELLKMRQQSSEFVYPSFATIAGFAENGAIIHYRSSEKTNKKLRGNSLFLLDSGGQYQGFESCGTTDITRTIAIGKPNAEMIENYTRVLKGHIALSCAKFPLGTSGAQLDALARNPLWQAGKDFAHGTGHGVGHFLSVHEGPCNISKRGHQALLPGMVLSNEPGFYEEGKYGIRLENLLLVEQFDEKFLQFRNLTLAPFDLDLIDLAMLNEDEKEWLRDYHNEILERLKSELNKEEQTWLTNIMNLFTRS